jgi:hypothetical protein
VNAPLRLALVASLCVGLTGCAEVAFRLAGMALGELLKEATSGDPRPLTQPARESCSEFTDKGVAVTALVEAAVPTNEGEVQTFEGTFWRFEFEGDRTPKLGQLGVGSERWGVGIATLAVTERSVLLLPPPNNARVRIPYDVVLTVEIDRRFAAITVKSCTGRFDIFHVTQEVTNKQTNATWRTGDTETAAAAAALIKARVVAFRATMQKQAKSPQQ